MANEKGKGVRYTFEGQYYTGSKEQAEQVRDYKLQVIFPQVYPNALSLFKTNLSRQMASGIYRMMKEKYPDFKTVRTYAVTNVEDLNGTEINTKNIATMNTKQLVKYIADNELEIDAGVYEGDITRLRNAITLAEKEPEKFKEVYKADVEEYNFNKDIKDLNNVPEGDSGKEENPNPDNTPDIDDLLGGQDNGGE